MKKLRHALIAQMITLSTAGFGLVAALAWNEAIGSFVNEYLVKYASVGSGIFSKFLYALIITTIAVLVTYQLTKLSGGDEDDKKED